MEREKEDDDLIQTSRNSETRRWEGFTEKKTGLLHEKNGMKCQDQTVIERRGDRYSAALLDGRGDTDKNAEGVKEIAEEVNHILLKDFENLYEEKDEREVANHLMIHIGKKIEKLSKVHKKPYEEFASTLLAFCIDEKLKKYIAIHLGDGTIAVKNSSDTIRIFSRPENGRCTNQTYLTTSEDVLKYVRVYRGTVDNQMKRVLLASDGFTNGGDVYKRIAECFSSNGKNVIVEGKVDDQAIIMLCR